MTFYNHFLLFPLFVSTFALQTPQQIHISYGADATEMMVTWVTMGQISGDPIVKYGVNELTDKAIGKTTRFVDGGSEKRHMYIHRVLLKDLKPSEKYMYKCGSDDGLSETVYHFVAMKNGTDWSPRLAIIGDLGYDNAQSVPRLIDEVNSGTIDAVLHVGDFAYDLNSDNARVGDEFMRIIEPIAANVPYQVCAGNHENHYNFSNYDNRFSMVDTSSGQLNNHFYSFNIGCAHIISINTEFYYYTEYGWDQIRKQFEWLEKDLKEANKHENRALRPWIIVMGHRPLYCMVYNSECSAIDSMSQQRSSLRKGIRQHQKEDLKYGLEELFFANGVDIEFYGHEHNYQRLFPVYNNQVLNGKADNNPYHNAKAPAIVVTGSAGCSENITKFLKNIPKWSAFRSTDYGYTRMTVHNKTHISIEQVSDDQKGKIVDQFVMIKDKQDDEPSSISSLKCNLMNYYLTLIVFLVYGLAVQ